jgi:hypothetical protein
MKAFHIALPFWVRIVLLAGVFCIVAGAGLISYRLYLRPTTLTVAVGSFDGEAKQIAAVIASRLATVDSPIRLKIENSGVVLDAARAFAGGTADLAVVRADVVDRQQARTVALTAHGVAMIVAPPGSTLTSIVRLRGHTVGVVGGEINSGIVEARKLHGPVRQRHLSDADGARRDRIRVRRGVAVSRGSFERNNSNSAARALCAAGADTKSR